MTEPHTGWSVDHGESMSNITGDVDLSSISNISPVKQEQRVVMSVVAAPTTVCSSDAIMEKLALSSDGSDDSDAEAMLAMADLELAKAQARKAATLVSVAERRLAKTKASSSAGSKASNGSRSRSERKHLSKVESNLNLSRELSAIMQEGMDEEAKVLTYDAPALNSQTLGLLQDELRQ